jgi:hypothetical protein
MRIRRLIEVGVLLLLLSGCVMEPTFDMKVKQFIDNACACSASRCECHDAYNSGNVVVVDCTNVTVSGMGDIIKRCNYWNEIDGWHWERVEVNKNVTMV